MSDAWAEVAAWLGGQAERVIETSCARVFLTGDQALKIKRPVTLPFLDFSTPAKRKWALERELAFNRRWAPDIYKTVRPIARGEAVEWALEMRRFDPGAVLAEEPEIVDGALAETLGRLIARDHIDAPVTPDGGGAATLAYTVATNEDALRAAPLDQGAVERLIAATRTAAAAIAPLLETRRREGFARHCHGDLHLGNILMEGGRPVLFDCIEFNDRLSRIDVLYDVAFTIMDLGVRGQDEAANRLLNAYLDEAARAFPPSLWDGLAALPVFLSIRAAIRAHVSAATGQSELAGAYLAAAETFLVPTPPRLIAVGGLSGTGKTTFARALAPRLGAVILRSDEIRKRIMGDAPYGPEMYDRVYGEMFDLAAAVLAAGRPVILDATFLDPEMRARADQLGAEGVWLEGDPSTLRARLATRAADASDANPAVLDQQLTRDLGPVTWRRVSAEQDLKPIARTLLEYPPNPLLLAFARMSGFY